LLGLGLLLLLAVIIWQVTKRHPHMWDEAPAEEALPPEHDDIAWRRHCSHSVDRAACGALRLCE
jgi:hypothetical protein